MKRIWQHVVFVALLVALAVPARAARINVEIRGVSRELKDNVEASLVIARIARRTNTEPDELIRLHERAEEEIRVALEPFGFYRPVVNLLFALDHAIWGLRPLGYQLTNLCILLAGVVTVFGLARRHAVARADSRVGSC